MVNQKLRQQILNEYQSPQPAQRQPAQPKHRWNFHWPKWSKGWSETAVVCVLLCIGFAFFVGHGLRAGARAHVTAVRDAKLAKHYQWLSGNDFHDAMTNKDRAQTYGVQAAKNQQQAMKLPVGKHTYFKPF